MTQGRDFREEDPFLRHRIPPSSEQGTITFFPLAGELQGSLTDGFGDGLIGGNGGEPFGLGLALCTQKVDQTQLDLPKDCVRCISFLETVALRCAKLTRTEAKVVTMTNRSTTMITIALERRQSSITAIKFPTPTRSATEVNNPATAGFRWHQRQARSGLLTGRRR